MPKKIMPLNPLYIDVDWVNTNLELIIDNLNLMSGYCCIFRQGKFITDVAEKYPNHPDIKTRWKRNCPYKLSTLHQYIQENKHLFYFTPDETHYASLLIKYPLLPPYGLNTRLEGKNTNIAIVVRYKETGKIAYKFIVYVNKKRNTDVKTLNDIIQLIHHKERMKIIRFRQTLRNKLGYNGM